VIKSRRVLVHSIHPRNFRNLADAETRFSPRANFISGPNGHGKTNLLEAIYWLVALRGKRGTAADAVRHVEPSADVHMLEDSHVDGTGVYGFGLDGELTFGDLRHRVGLAIEGRSRRLLIDGTPPRRRREYLEQVLVVDFFPEDLLILTMEPSLRRRFIDLACVQYSLPHEEPLRRFKRILEQRNSLLRSPGAPDVGVLESFDQPLAEYASEITAARLNLLARLGERTDAIFRDGIGERYRADLQYISVLRAVPKSIRPDEQLNPDEFRKLYLDSLRRARSRDIEAGRTTIGPHRDDWGMSLDGKPVRTYASRGEVRSAMFALHLARFHTLTEKRGIEPVVLIDDVMSELDASRRARVLQLLPPGQIFLTACDPPAEIGRIGGDELAHFVMERGRARRIG